MQTERNGVFSFYSQGDGGIEGFYGETVRREEVVPGQPVHFCVAMAASPLELHH